MTSVLPGSTSPDDSDAIPAVDGPRRSSTSRRGLVVNGVVATAVLLVLGMIVVTVRGTDAEPTSTAQTTTVSTGDVTATVSANGNIAPGTTINTDFQGSGGVVTAILVSPGDPVRKGQILAKVESTTAEQGLARAQVQLRSAQASYAATVQGQTSAEYQRDLASIDQAEISVTSAESSLRSARQSLALTHRQQDASVERAADSLAMARDDLEQAQNAYQADPTPENEQAVTAAQDAVDSAQIAVTLAKENRDSALLQAHQQLASAELQVKSSQAGLASTKASVAINRQGATSSTIAQAQAGVDSAAISVAEARLALAQTELRAPVAGRVAQVNGTVGEPNTSASGSTTSSGTGSSTTDASGFIVLTGAHALQVTADVAEADIADVRVGQGAGVTLSASGREISGTVTGVDSIETVTNNVVEYGVTVTLDETRGVKLGQSTQVVITTGTKQGVLRVSSSALTSIGQQTTATVQQADGTTTTTQVLTGLEGDGFTEILSGLADGDTVVLPEQSASGADFTFPGAGGFGQGLP
jgi:multidrug efflux pump subunit AcrA (membrane-fusion protein)